MGEFQVICQNALTWLSVQPDHSLGNVVTGIPDLDETPYSLANYQKFVQKAVKLIFKKVAKNGYCLFMNTDRKHQKTWIDKSFWIQQLAQEAKIPLKWHKIILLRPVNSTHIQRPTYQHYLCFSYQAGPGEATPDVFMCGKKAYSNASCPNGVTHAMNFIKRYSNSDQVIDPFVGRGTVLKIAQDKGLSGIGIDLDRNQCRLTRQLLKLKPRPSLLQTTKLKTTKTKTKTTQTKTKTTKTTKDKATKTTKDKATKTTKDKATKTRTKRKTRSRRKRRSS